MQIQDLICGRTVFGVSTGPSMKTYHLVGPFYPAYRTTVVEGYPAAVCCADIRGLSVLV
jgi:hypothetical protein